MLSDAALAEGSGDHMIDRVEVGDDGFNLYAKGGDFGSAVCSGGAASTINYAISFNRANFPNGYSDMLSTTLAAHMGGKKMSMWYGGCQSSPWNNGQMPKALTIVVK